MKKLLSIIVLLTLPIVISCKKESDVLTSEATHINIVLSSVNRNIESPLRNSYTLIATIISPKRINMVEHGFIFSTSSSGVNSGLKEYRMGGTSKAGLVSFDIDFDLTTFIDESSVIFFIDLEDGTRITSGMNDSTGGVPSSGPAPQFQSPVFNISTDATGVITSFTIDINAYDAVRYSLVAYGIEYAYDTLATNGYAYYGQNSNLLKNQISSAQGAQTLVSELIAGTDVSPGNNYSVRYYIVFRDNQTLQETILVTTTVPFLAPFPV